jgi:hypothetical protein
MPSKKINQLETRVLSATDLMLVGDPSTGVSFKSLISGLGSVYVPNGTTLTINGTTLNLTTNRSWSVGTVTSVDLTAGTGISVSGGPITTSGNINIVNTAPDQVVSLTGGGTTIISGTYPNFTISSADSNVGTVTSVNMTVPTGLTISGNPITSAGTLALALASGYSIPTTANQANWDSAYNDKINSASVTGTTTKTLTLNQQDGGTVTASWTDDNTDAVTSVFGRTGAVIAVSGDYTTAQVTEATNLYFTGDRVRATLLTGLNLVGGGTIAATDSILQAFGKTQNQISALVGGVMYEGVWNASTNSPAIVSSVGNKGDYYVVSVAGSTNIDGISDWKIGDWIIFNGTTWDKVDNTDAVSSVNGFTGAVSLTTANISEVTNLYFTDTRVMSAMLTGYTIGSNTAITFNDSVLTAFGKAQAQINTKQNIVTLTTTGSSGSATFVSDTLNVPTYTLAGLGGQPQLNGTGFVKISGTTISYDNSTYYLASNPNSFIALTALSAGTGISYSSTTGVITNTAPDQVVSLSAGSGISISGTYPSFTIASTITQYTDALARLAISESATGLDYNNTTGVFSLTSGYVIPTTSSATNWDAAYNDKINSAAVTGTTTKTLTLNQQDGGTITASWTDFDTAPVTSVFGRTGAVVATSGDYTTTLVTEGTNLYYTEGRVSANTDVAANTAARHNAVTIGTANGLSLSTQVLSLGLASSSANGALSSTDWSTFNGKQNTITLTTTGTSGAATLVGATLNIPQYADQFVGTVTSVSALTLGTTGTDLSSTVANGTTTPVITLNVPTASATNRGALSSGDWTIFNNKQSALNGTGFVKISGTTISYDNSTYYLASNPSAFIALTALTASAPLSYNNTTGAFTIAQASGSTSGYLSSTDWTTFNNKQNTITNPVTGTGTTNYLPKWTSGTAIGNSIISESGSVISVAGSITTSGGFKFTGATWTNQASVGGIDYANGVRFYSLGANSSTKSGFEWHTNSSDGSIDVTAMKLDANGQLGIGTTSPSAKLHVVGDGLFSSSTNTALTVSSSGGVALINLTTGAGTQAIYGGVGGSNVMDFYTASAFKMRLDASGNLGLGTTSPAYKLDLYGSQRIYAGATGGLILEATSGAETPNLTFLSTTNRYNLDNSSGNLRFFREDADGTNGAVRMLLTDTGNLGLGVVPSAWASGAKAFQLGGYSSLNYLNVSSNHYTVLGHNVYNDTSNNDVYSNTGAASQYYQNAGSHVWRTTASGTAGSTITFTQAMTLGTNSGLSIGTTTAAAANGLLVAGAATFSSSVTVNAGSNDGIFSNVTGAVIGLKITQSNAANDALLRMQTNGHFYDLRATSTNALSIDYDGSERLRITSGGSLQIGTSSSSGARTFIYDNRSNSSNVDESALYVRQDGTNAIQTWAVSGGNERMRITSGGNLLVGTTADNGSKLQLSGKLFVSNSSTDYIAEFINTSASTPYGVIIKDAASAANNYPLFHIVNNAASVEYFRVNSGTGNASFSGSVAIGNSVATGVAVASTHKVSIVIGGVQYYLLASNV